jgi:hypothetical protein
LAGGLGATDAQGCRLLRAQVTTPGGLHRTLFLLQSQTGDTVFLVPRPKGDPVGAPQVAMPASLPAPVARRRLPPQRAQLALR